MGQPQCMPNLVRSGRCSHVDAFVEHKRRRILAVRKAVSYRQPSGSRAKAGGDLRKNDSNPVAVVSATRIRQCSLTRVAGGNINVERQKVFGDTLKDFLNLGQLSVGKRTGRTVSVIAGKVDCMVPVVSDREMPVKIEVDDFIRVRIGFQPERVG